MNIRVKKLQEDAKLPELMTEGSAGFDLSALNVKRIYLDTNRFKVPELIQDMDTPVFINPGERVLIGTGLAFSIPEGYEMQIRDRSGLSLRRGLKVFNSPGTIDSDYRGEVGIILWNTTRKPIEILRGERIAQAIISKVEKVEWELANLEETERGEGGFGSTNDN